MSIPEVALRPFILQDAEAFTHAVNQSLGSLLPWMVWAHKDYSVDEAVNWINFTHLSVKKVKLKSSRLSMATIGCWAVPAYVMRASPASSARWATGFAARRSNRVLPAGR
ncbi:hypothetical protein E05_25240 [Plautia stali symbiont]|nr:hypothetical protein E05_25240 [Plautia stali symbiont]